MRAVLVFIDGTICDARHRYPLRGAPDFSSLAQMLRDAPVPGSVEFLRELAHDFAIVYMGARPAATLPQTEEWLARNGFPRGPVYLAPTQEERLALARQLRQRFTFVAGIGDRWDDNELHLEIGCLSIILKEHEGNWDTARRHLLPRPGAAPAPEPSPDCFVCRKHRGEIQVPGGAIYEDALVYAGHAQSREGQSTAYLGYLMAEPKRHVSGLGDLTDQEARALGELVTRLARALRDAEGAVHVYSFVLGHHIPHLHIHVVPLYPGAPREYWGWRVDEWPDAPRGGPATMAAVCGRVRAHLQESAPR